MTEIEKKYLIREERKDFTTKALQQYYETIDDLIHEVTTNGKKIRQGYMNLEQGKELTDYLNLKPDFKPEEARLRDKAGEYYFTMKGSGGLERNELEVKVDKDIFQKYWSNTQGKRIEKIRQKIPYQGFELEIDVYTDRELIVAEIEVPTISDANSLIPVGKDITQDKNYKNKNLAN